MSISRTFLVFALLGAALAFTAAAPNAKADTFITWTFEDVSFPSSGAPNGFPSGAGGSVSGSFTLDTDSLTTELSALSDIDVLSTSDATFSGGTYLYADPLEGPPVFQVVLLSSNAANLTGADQILFNFDSPLTTSGTDTLSSVYEGQCETATCNSGSILRSEDVTGYATSSAPEPSTGSLLGVLGVATALAIRIRKTVAINDNRA
jgi:hypothetical protein